MFAKPEKEFDPAQVFEEAVCDFRRKDYATAAAKFKYLSGLGTIQEADRYYSLTVAALDCHDGFFGRALGIYEELDSFQDAQRLAQALRRFLTPYNGFFKSQDEFLSNYLFVHNGKAALENGFLFGGKPDYAYDLQYKKDRIYCRYFLSENQRSKDCVLQFNKACNAVKLLVPKNVPSGFAGLYYRADYAYEMQRRKTL